jgi:hypothetical protein
MQRGLSVFPASADPGLDQRHLDYLLDVSREYLHFIHLLLVEREVPSPFGLNCVWGSVVATNCDHEAWFDLDKKGNRNHNLALELNAGESA